MNLERLIVGMATVFDEPDLRDREVWHAADFADFVGSEFGAPIWLEHRNPISPSEVLGTWFAFAAVKAFAERPAGLLAIGQFGHSPAAEANLERLRQEVTFPLRSRWGLSVGYASERDGGSRRWIDEVSLTTTPAYEQGRVIDVGPNAANVWELLTGSPPPAVKALTPRTVRGRLLGIAGGKRIYEEWTE